MNFEFDKIVGAIAIAVFIFIMSNNLGDALYGPIKEPLNKGYKIEIPESSAQGESAPPPGLPALILIGKIMSGGNADLGKEIFKKCSACHVADKTGANKTGPNLWNILGAKKGHSTSFAYSNSLAKLNQAGSIWSYEDLYRFLYAPKQFIPGTKMGFAGLKKDEDRANVIAYLRTMADQPLALPTIEK